LKLQIEVKGYCVDPRKHRLEKLEIENREIDITEQKEETVEIEEGVGKRKTAKKTKNKRIKQTPVWELPDKYDPLTKRYFGLKRTYEYIQDKFPLQVQGILAGILRIFDSHKAPPEGRYGVTEPAQMYAITLENLQITFVHFNEFAKKVTVLGASKGSFNIYADQIDFTGTLNIENPMFHNIKFLELFKKILSYVPLRKIGAYQHGRMVKIEIVKENS